MLNSSLKYTFLGVGFILAFDEKTEPIEISFPNSLSLTSVSIEHPRLEQVKVSASVHGTLD